MKTYEAAINDAIKIIDDELLKIKEARRNNTGLGMIVLVLTEIKRRIKEL